MTTQLSFSFLKQAQPQQLELFPENVYDNRIQRLHYAMKVYYTLNSCLFYKIDKVKECVKLFKVNYETVFNHILTNTCHSKLE